MKSILAITGYAGSGKSTAAEYLVQHHGYVRFKFASPLKDMLRAFGLTEQEIEGDLKEKPCRLLMGKTPRQAMIALGTEWGRNLIDPALWTSHLIHRVNESGADRVVIDDCRFLNEAAAIAQLGGRVVRVYRTECRSSHASETEMDKIAIHYSIDNRETIRRLLAAMDTVVWLENRRIEDGKHQ